MSQPASFSPAFFSFLEELAANNRREWFQAHKERYEDEVKDAALRFISDFGPPLREISPHFTADPRPVGGSLFRIFRDTRFAKDKTPYKTHVGIQFRHKLGKGAHAPGFYLHLAAEEVWAGAGIWHPDSSTLGRIRDAIVADPTAWERAVTATRAATLPAGAGPYELGGDALARPPRGYDRDHPSIEDLKRKDFFVRARFRPSDALAPGFLGDYATTCRAASPLLRFLCRAVGVEF